MRKELLIQSFYDRIDWSACSAGHTCWQWLGSKRTPAGYGACGAGGNILAHRRSYEFFVGPIPEGAIICHKCDNPGCVNPDHLYAGTSKTNSLDRVRRKPNSFPVGEKHHLTHLTNDDVRMIRRLEKFIGQREIAKTFGICKSSVANIQGKRTWAHVK